MTIWGRQALAGIAALVFALIVAAIGARTVLGENVSTTLTIVRYVAISGGAAIVLGILATTAGSLWLPRLSFKIALAYVIGGVGAILTVVYTPLLMFRDHGDLELLVLILLCFLVISIGMSTIIAFGLTERMRLIRQAARAIADGEFDTRLTIPAKDELADVALAFNLMSERLGEAARRTESMESDRRTLVASVSHDLRTPLAAIRAMLEAIQDGVVDSPATVAEYHRTMLSQLDRLGRLIDALFELSRVESGALGSNAQRVDLADFVAETVSSFEPVAQRAGLSLRSEVVGASCARVDPDQLQRAVGNIVANAMEHTPPGGTITIHAGRTGSEAEIAIADTGRGITPEDLPHVFDRFYRGGQASQLAPDGMGLGLAIARALVESNNGRIEAESTAPHGARFILTLPAD